MYETQVLIFFYIYVHMDAQYTNFFECILYRTVYVHLLRFGRISALRNKFFDLFN